MRIVGGVGRRECARKVAGALALRPFPLHILRGITAGGDPARSRIIVTRMPLRHRDLHGYEKGNRVSRLWLVVPFAGAAFVSACGPVDQQSVEAAIRERVRQYEAAYNAGDADAVAAIYAVDGTHTYALGFTHRGRPEIADGLRELFAGPFKGTRLTITPLHIRALSSDVAVEEASFSFSGLKEPGGTDLPPMTGLCAGVYQKQGDLWFAAAVQCMVPPPTSPPR